jgi:nucleotide-binding universal stress UspA family protein
MQNMLETKAAVLRNTFPHHQVFADLLFGPTVDRIIVLAAIWEADLIVMGSHRRYGLNRIVLGSVAEGVVEKSPCSVEVIKSGRLSQIPQNGSRAPGSELQQEKILICYDGSANCIAALDWVAGSHWSPEQQFCILTVLAPLQDTVSVFSKYTHGRDLEGAQAQLCRQAERVLLERAKPLTKRILAGQIHTVVCCGYAAETIVQFSDEWGADLIVLGAHTKTIRSEPLLGSVAKPVTGMAKCSVKIVRATVPSTDRKPIPVRV